MPEGTTENHGKTKVHTVSLWAVTPNHIESHPQKTYTFGNNDVRTSERASYGNSNCEGSQLKEVNIKI
jgi:hypothetical protein